MSFLGLDVGTTGTKACIFDEQGQMLSSGYREYPLINPQPGWLELDPNRVWESVRDAVGEATVAAGEPVSALAISVLGEAAIPVDIAGNALDNGILGFDNRAADLWEDWVRTQDPMELMAITGQPPSQMFTLAKLMWIRRERETIYKKMHRYVSFDAFVQLRMGLEPKVDYSMASRTMAFDIGEKRYHEGICESAGVNPSLFCEAVPTGRIIGELGDSVVAELGLPSGCIVCAGSHDQPAGALGSGVTQPGIAMDATGTVECFAVTMDEPVTNRVMLDNNLACYPHAVPRRYISLAYNFTGGALFRWVRDTFGEAERQQATKTDRDVYELLAEQMSDVPTELLVQPHFTMSGTPYMDPEPVGAIVGLTLSTGRGEFLRGLLEGVSYEMKLNLEKLQQAGVRVQQFRASGGGAKSDFWLQLKADMYKRPIVRLEVEEAASLGMALVAGSAAGAYSSAEDAAERIVGTKETFEPDPNNAAFYDEMLETYRDLYPTLKRWQSATEFSPGVAQ